MKDWTRPLAPFALAAALLILTVAGVSRTQDARAVCLGDSPESFGMTGSAAPASTYQFDFCSDPTLDLQVLINWGNSKKDLALRVTEPDGTVHWVDHSRTLTESYFQAAPLPEGTWTIDVVNQSGGNVKYSQSITLD